MGEGEGGKGTRSKDRRYSGSRDRSGSEVDHDNAALRRLLFLFARSLDGVFRDRNLEPGPLLVDAFGLFPLSLPLELVDDESIEHVHILLPKHHLGRLHLPLTEHLHLRCQGARKVAPEERSSRATSAPSVTALSFRHRCKPAPFRTFDPLRTVEKKSRFAPRTEKRPACPLALRAGVPILGTNSCPGVDK